ncbi:MAG TPA: MFS transporter [Methanocorpusculum sp.]|nr:MFS transporter [Methanocorpusculum sp.]
MEKIRLTAKQMMISVTVAIACFLPPFIGSATGLIASDIINFFGYEAAFGSGLFPWVFTTYTLASTIFLIPAARLADKFNKKIFFLIGVLLLGASSLGIGFSTTMEMLLFMRVVQGIGNALMFGTAIALVAAAVPPKIRGTAIGIAMTGVFLGQLAAPLTAGALTNAIGWYAVYVVLLPVALLSFILAIICIPKDAPIDTGKFDWIGSLIFIVGMAFAVYGFSKLPDMTAVICMVVGIILMIFFFVWEKRNANPLMPVDLILKNRGFSFNSGANLLYYVAIYSMDSLISTYMAELWGIEDPFLRALIITTEGLILVFFTIMAGRFYDHMLPKFVLGIGGILAVVAALQIRHLWDLQTNELLMTGAVIVASIAAFAIGSIILGIIDLVKKDAPPKYATSLGLLIIIGGMVVFLFSGEEMNLWLLIVVEALFGIGISIFVTPNSTAIMNSVSEKEYSMASGTLSTVRMLGMALSFGIVAILETLFITGVAESYSSEFLTMLHGTIIASIVVLAAAILLSWFGVNKEKAAEE